VDLFVTGTDTGVGKTVLSALLVAALGRSYWKPIQTGRMAGRVPTDRETVIASLGLPPGRAFPETYLFDPPVSPHLAAREAGVTIRLEAIRRPETDEALVIEGAGGALVPINDRHLMVDVMSGLGAPVLVAARTSLGTINHTLLTLEAVRQRSIGLVGVVLIGTENRENRRAIEHYGGAPVAGWIPPLRRIDRRGLLEPWDHHFDHALPGPG
jgi:malonyl-CoA O-methyltransferase